MKIVFSGFEKPLEVSKGYARTLEVENKTLFTRICASLLSNKGELAAEPYSVWDEEGCEIAPATAFLAVANPLELPWDSKDLEGKLLDHMNTFFLEDEVARSHIEHLSSELNSDLMHLTHQIDGDYSFGLEWNIQRYLKAFSFSIARPEEETFLETLNRFIDFCADMSLKKTILFVNLKEFLSGEEFKLFLERIFFHKIQVIFLESTLDQEVYLQERKIVIDQYFLENY